MADKEALARVKIDKMLTECGWQLIDDGERRKNVVLEQGYRKSGSSKFTDYLLLDKYNRPISLIEAKKKDYPLKSAKRQAMDYAIDLKLNSFYLSNGDEYLFCNVADGVLHTVDRIMSQDELIACAATASDSTALWEEDFDATVLAEIKMPSIKSNPQFIDSATKDAFIKSNRLKLLRDYQKEAVEAIIKSAQKGNYRFLLEMATGTGKTLTCAAIIELFLRTHNAHRVLFLVDRIELENQAKRSFDNVFNNGQHYTVSILKEDISDGSWRSAQIVITTVQTMLASERYTREFLPSDFDLIIVDEAHRTIGGKARNVFEYFVGYKIGLTATPKDYFRGVNTKRLLSEDLYEYDARAFRDTYITFGCYSGEPTYRFDLSDGVRKNILVQPYAIDARTDVSFQLLSDGLTIHRTKSGDLTQEEQEELVFDDKDFEKTLFSEKTNELFCRMFLENAKRDPITHEIGKTIIFCVTQNHAGKIANMLNRLIKEYEPEKWTRYDGCFAEQITSSIPDRATMTQQFTNDFNDLNGCSRYYDEADEYDYKTSKTRVCCTVSMMTTGYDCQDLLNICLMRPVIQPSEFIQIKGRGTRIFDFVLKGRVAKKDDFYFFDYFGNFERFEHYDYDKKLKTPKEKPVIPSVAQPSTPQPQKEEVVLTGEDGVRMLVGAKVGESGMAIDRQFNKGTTLREAMISDEELKDAVSKKDWTRVVEIVNEKYNNKQQFGFENNESIGKSMCLQRIPSWRELVELFYGIKDRLKTKEELLQEAVAKCMAVFNIEEIKKKDIRKLIEAYVESKEIRAYIREEKFMMFDYTGIYSVKDFMELGKQAVQIAKRLQEIIPEELIRSVA